VAIDDTPDDDGNCSPPDGGIFSGAVLMDEVSREELAVMSDQELLAYEREHHGDRYMGLLTARDAATVLAIWGQPRRTSTVRSGAGAGRAHYTLFALFPLFSESKRWGRSESAMMALVTPAPTTLTPNPFRDVYR
jgi:hypothetical protein